MKLSKNHKSHLHAVATRPLLSKINEGCATLINLIFNALEQKNGTLAINANSLLKQYIQFAEEAESIQNSIKNPELPTFIIHESTLRELVDTLTPDENEAIAYLSGIQIGALRVLFRIHPVELDHASPVRAVENLSSTSDTLIRLINANQTPLAQAHRHPGRGANATYPSTTDHNTFRKFEQGGSTLLGIIVTQDRAIRFFTHKMKFHVLLDGSDDLELKKEGQTYVVQIP